MPDLSTTPATEARRFIFNDGDEVSGADAAAILRMMRKREMAEGNGEALSVYTARLMSRLIVMDASFKPVAADDFEAVIDTLVSARVLIPIV